MELYGIYDLPPLPDDPDTQTTCESFSPVFEVSMGMGGNIDGIAVCDACRFPVTINLIDKQWVHAPKLRK